MRTTDTQKFVKERRSTVRENVRIPAKIAFQNKALDVTLVDLSDRGLAINGPADLAMGVVLEIELGLPDSKPIACTGVVAWSTKEMAGIEFSFVSATAAESIDEWLKDQSSSHAKAGKS